MKQICLGIITLLASCYGFIYCAKRLPLNTKEDPFISKWIDNSQEQCYKRMPHKKGEPLRILFVVESFPHFDQPFILNQIVGVINRGHEVYIAARSEVKNNMVPDVVHQYNLMKRTLFFGESNPLELLQHHSRIPHINTFDVICCQFGNIGADMVRFKRGMHDISARLVTCWRGASKEATMQPYAYALLFKHGDLFLPVCEFLKNNIIDLGCDPRKIQVLYVGINYDHYVCERVIRADGTINLMSICRLVEKKGLEYAIRAVASLIKIHPNIHYTIVGDGPLKKHLELLVKQLHMQDYITFIGNQPHEKVPEFLSQADIFLSPSVTTCEGNHEGIANSLKEAMASGALVIATDHAGTRELINDGISGFLVPERNSAALAEKINYLIIHPEIWNTMRFYSRQAVQERFCLADSIDQFIAIIEEICVQ